MRIQFTKTADGQLKDWVKSDKAVARKIYDLITHHDRLVYSLDKDDVLTVFSCKGHYED